MLRPTVALLFAAAVSAQDFARETDAVFARWNRTDSPGCALAVIKGGEVAYAKGYGMANLEHGIPITKETVFYAGSTSKQFVTICIALLEEQDELSFDDEVRKHVPEFPKYDEPVTIRQLIHHTSGVRDYLELAQLSGRSYLDHLPAKSVLELICRQKELNFAPGTRYLYSNSCYFLLSVIVERVSGLSLRDYAQKHVFKPLGMTSSRFHDQVGELIPRKASGYAPNRRGGYQDLIMRFDLVGSGGLYTTVEDLAKWDANFDDNRLGQTGPELIGTMLTRGRLDDGTRIPYAFALVHGKYRGADTVSHGGALGGYRAMYLRFPEHSFSVAILSNLTNLNPGARAYEVADIHLGDMLEPKSKEASGQLQRASAADRKRPFDLTAEAAAEIAGDYDSAELQTRYRLRADGKRLTGAIRDDTVTIRPTSDPDRFTAQGVTLRVERDGDGQITGFRLSTGRVKNVLFTRAP